MEKHKLRLGVLISGTGTNLQAIIDAAKAGRIDASVVVVISDTRGALGLERARNHGICAEVIERASFGSRDEFETAIVSQLKQHGVELVCLAGFMRVLGKVVLEAFPGRIINIHPALLPSFAGLEAQRKALEYGVKIAGCTVHFVDEKADHGPVIVQAAVEVKEDDTVSTLRERILREEHRIYPKAIQLIAQGRLEITGRRVRVKKEDRR